MAYTLQPWRVCLAALAGWINRHQQAAIDFLREENRVLLEQLGNRRIRLTADERRRPAVMKEIERLAVRFPRESPSWGYRRIGGALANLLKRQGIDPAPERRSRTSCRTFLGAHWLPIAAIDFTTVEVWGRHGLVTMCVLFAVDLRGRGVHFAGMTPGPDEAWIRQVGRNLTDPLEGFLHEKRCCRMDRDAKFTTAFRTLLAGAGIEPVRLPRVRPT